MLKNHKKFVVFLIPPEEQVSGGIMSIFSLCRETRALLKKDTTVILSTFPGTASYKRNTLFENDETIYDFTAVVKLLPKLESLTLHIPEYEISRITHSLIGHQPQFARLPHFLINILNQNMELMPSPQVTAGLYALSPALITQTTAHKRYTTQELSDRYNTPLLNFSVYLDTSQYETIPYNQKENIIAYSNDQHSDKDAILTKLKEQLPNYSLIEITGLSYEEYKALIKKSKYLITFGEGFDGYLIEGIFSGSITFAVYNDTFFASKEFLQYENIYRSYDDMSSRIINDIKVLDNEERYKTINQKNYTTLSEIYDRSIYLKNLKNFYSNDFTYLPSPAATKSYFNYAILQREQIIDNHNQTIYEKDLLIQAQAQDLNKINALLVEAGGRLTEMERVNQDQALFIQRIQKNAIYRLSIKLNRIRKLIIKKILS